MRKFTFGAKLLVGMYVLGATTIWAQTNHGNAIQNVASTDLAVTYITERGQAAPSNCGCFWLQGAGIDAAANLRNGLGLAASLSGNHASSVTPGLDISKIQLTAGPRYTYTRWNSRSGSGHAQWQLFGQSLFGAVFGFNGLYPSGAATATAANAFALKAGGGMNLFLTGNMAMRLFEVDYIRSYLPNNGSNVQNDINLAFGVSWRFERRRSGSGTKAQ